MLRELKLVIKEEGKVLDTLKRETSTQSCHLVKSLEEFQQSANAALTKLIEKFGDTAEIMKTEYDEESEDDDEDYEVTVTPKKIRK